MAVAASASACLGGTGDLRRVSLIGGLRSMRNYDPVFHVVAAGGSVWFGSSADDSVRYLDAATGRQKWCCTTGGPVRVAPTFAAAQFNGGRLYFGLDDGYAY